MKILLIRHGMTKGNAEHRYVGSTDEGLLPEERERLLTLAKTGRYKADKVLVSPMRRCIETAEILFSGGSDCNDCGVADTVDRQESLMKNVGMGVGETSVALKNADHIENHRMKNLKMKNFSMKDFIAVDAFREMNFGAFEYMTYKEINEHPDTEYRAAYQRYIDSNGESAFPGGESKAEFCDRVVHGFAEALKSEILKSDGNVFSDKVFYTPKCIKDVSQKTDLISQTGIEKNFLESDGSYHDETIAIVAHGGTIMALMDRFSDPHKDYFEWSVKPGESYLVDVISGDGHISFRTISRIERG